MTRIIRRSLFFLLTFVAAACLLAQAQGGVDILLSKARSLESRGRMDLAAQNWKQVLLVNPNQTEALAGLARYAKESARRTTNVHTWIACEGSTRKIRKSPPSK